MVFRKTLPVIEHNILNRDYAVLKVRDRDLAVDCRPGMFFELKAAVESQRRKLFKPISVYAVDEEKISFLVKEVGEGTQTIIDLREGDYLHLIGPLGNAFPVVEGKSVLLVSGGVGYPPLAYLKEVLAASNQITLLHGGACQSDVFPCDVVYTDDGSMGKPGFVTEGVKSFLEEENPDIVYSCGPVPMLKAVAALVRPVPHFVSLEAYMACGVGVCYGCAVPVGEDYQRVCKDGPVFAADLIRWEEL